MKARPILTEDDVIRFVRGEKPWSMLVVPGVEIEFVDEKIRAKSGGRAVAAPKIADVAQGLLRYKDDARALREWAAVMLALGEIDLRILDEDPNGEALREILWDASFGEELNSSRWELVGRLRPG